MSVVLILLILLPLAGGLAALGWGSLVGRRVLLLAVAVAHAGLTGSLWIVWPEPDPGAWLALDTPGLLFLSITSVLFLAAAVYTTGYLAQEYRTEHIDPQEGFLFSTIPSAAFTACLMLFLAAMTAVCLSRHFGLLWVSIEATTLASAPLIYFHKHHRSLEATWKYLLICSVGIALALLGNFLLAFAARGSGGEPPALVLGSLIERAGELNLLWLKAAFLFFLVGYGTKMGLAPMHTWLPDAHSEAPSNVSALLSGALLNCAFLGIFRVHQVFAAAGEAAFSGDLLIVFGLLSMAVAAVFILRQADFKRMLAYSSIEHMGILSIGLGLGAAGTFGAMLHAFGHSLTKAALFLVAGNIFTAFDSKLVADVRGARRLMPVSAALWIAGFLAITGSPPFSTFLSEFTILKAALDGGRGVVAVLYLVLLALVFIGMANIVLPMSQGELSNEFERPKRREPLWSTAPPAVLTALVLGIGLWIPSGLNTALNETATLSAQKTPSEVAADPSFADPLAARGDQRRNRPDKFADEGPAIAETTATR